MKQTVISMLLAGIVSLPAITHSAFEEINTNPALSAGKYYAYQAPEAKLTPVPEGYTPFYISTFARHGSRYLTKKKKYDSPLSILKEAARQHKLTTDGQRALNIIEKLAEEAAGRYGELTPKGAQQHKDLIRRMYTNYPQVFTDGTHVDARSTYKTRAFLSMAAACVELKGLNPRLVITTDASEHDAYYIKYKNPTYEEAHLANADSVYQAADSVYIHPERLMKQLFINADIVKDPKQFMADLFEHIGFVVLLFVSRCARAIVNGGVHLFFRIARSHSALLSHFHNVDLPACRPFFVVISHHPKRRPQSAVSLGKLDTCFYLAILETLFPF